MALANIIAWADLVAVAVFAVSGALAAAGQRLDILGFMLFGTLTGVGGGTLRDLLLQAGPVFWIEQTRYLWVCLLASVLVWFVAPLLASRARALVWADAAGLALFCVIGTERALVAGAPAVVAVVMGVMTVSFGSLIRDTLLNRHPVMLEPEIYVSAAAIGSLAYITLLEVLGPGSALAPLIAMGVAFALRAAGIMMDLRLTPYGR
jgi:uncharacterized membrane protein YeiH